MWNASSFLSCRTVELQLPTDACLLPGNQHSISPSTFNPQTHTCTDTHSYTQMYIPLPHLPATSGEDTNDYWLLWLFSSILLLILFFSPCLPVGFFKSLKSCNIHGFLKENWHFPFLAYTCRGNWSCNTLPTVMSKCVIHGKRISTSIMLSGKHSAERWQDAGGAEMNTHNTCTVHRVHT